MPNPEPVSGEREIYEHVMAKWSSGATLTEDESRILYNYAVTHTKLPVTFPDYNHPDLVWAPSPGRDGEAKANPGLPGEIVKASVRHSRGADRCHHLDGCWTFSHEVPPAARPRTEFSKHCGQRSCQNRLVHSRDD